MSQSRVGSLFGFGLVSLNPDAQYVFSLRYLFQNADPAPVSNAADPRIVALRAFNLLVNTGKADYT
jgi:hypothetical protein